MTMNLPAELLLEVLSYLIYPDLASCARVNRTISEPALAVLYRDIDLNRFDGPDDDPDDKESSEKSLRRQRNLLNTIAKRPSIGILVHSFSNATDGETSDATEGENIDTVLEAAAKNMKELRRAAFNRNALSTAFLNSVASYSHLQDLSLHGICPATCHWDNINLPLTRLSWDFLPLHCDERPWKSVISILEIALDTCPELIWLEISGPNPSHEPVIALFIESSSRHPNLAQTEKRLRNLQHLAFKGECMRLSLEEYDHNYPYDLLAFINKHRDSLKSATVAFDLAVSKKNLEWALQACTGLHQLTSLTLEGMPGSGSPRSYEYLRRLIFQLSTSNPLLERFSMTSIGGTLSASMGKLFKPFNNLKFLQLGDGDNEGGPFADDGRISFEAYKPFQFIQELPPSLEELYLMINGHELQVDDDEDFDPICEIGADIFKTLQRLHSCDIIAWISNLDGGLGRYPEKAVHWRRLPRVTQPGSSNLPSNKVRDILQSRMDSIYQEEEPIISQHRLTVELGEDEGVFQGKDAEDTWFAVELDGQPMDVVDRSWPWKGNLVQKYPLYKRDY